MPEFPAFLQQLSMTSDFPEQYADFVLQSYQQELFPLGHSCAVCGKIKCKRHR